MPTPWPDHPMDDPMPRAAPAPTPLPASSAVAVLGHAGRPFHRTRKTNPWARRAWLAAILAFGVATGAAPRPAAAQDQTSEPPAEPPAETAVPPPPAEPTAVPPPAPTDVPPPAPPGRDDDDDDDQPAPPAPTEVPVPGVATRTPRPTRTPRTTPTTPPTAMAMGVLRMTVGTAPRGLDDETSVTVVVTLANRGADPVAGATLDIDTAAGFLLSGVDAAAGQTARAGSLVRWYLPQIDAGTEAVLRLTGTPAAVGGRRPTVCATLISAGSPVEHCVEVEPPPAAGAAAAPPVAATLPTAEPAGTLAAEAPGALRSGWTLFILGLLALGVWGGMQWRGRGSQPGPG